MEFSNYYGIVQAGGSMDKNGFYGAATFTDDDGNVLVRPHHDTRDRQREHVAARGRAARPHLRDLRPRPGGGKPKMRARMPNFFIAFDRAEIDPFRQTI